MRHNAEDEHRQWTVVDTTWGTPQDVRDYDVEMQDKFTAVAQQYQADSVYFSACKSCINSMSRRSADQILDNHVLCEAYPVVGHQVLSDANCSFCGKVLWILAYKVGLQ